VLYHFPTIDVTHLLRWFHQAIPKKHVMKAALKSGVEKGLLVQVKNSYKLSAEAKKKPAAPKKETTTAKPKKAVTKKVRSTSRFFQERWFVDF
jgi:hypothetical protein